MYVSIPILRTGKRTKVTYYTYLAIAIEGGGGRGGGKYHTHQIHSLKKHAKLCLSVLKTGPISIVSLLHENMKTHS